MSDVPATQANRRRTAITRPIRWLDGVEKAANPASFRALTSDLALLYSPPILVTDV
jgi:hypothetical protein